MPKLVELIIKGPIVLFPTMRKSGWPNLQESVGRSYIPQP